MKQIDMIQIKKWIHRNARAVDLAKWKYHFEDGKAIDVMQELSYYQNEDGGFAHGLEADCLNIHSAPSQLFHAIHIIDDINFKDTAHPVIQNILKYLQAGTEMENGYWMSILPSNNAYPHAPWWVYRQDVKTFDVYMPNADICYFILQFAEKDSVLYKQAMQMIEQMIQDFENQEDVEMHCISSMMFLLDKLDQLGLKKQFQYDQARNHALALIRNLIECNPKKWEGYCVTPSFYITSKDHPLYHEYKDLLDLEMQLLVQNRNDDGVWDINWTWGDYDKEFHISENWWKSIIIINRLRMLDNLGFLHESIS